MSPGIIPPYYGERGEGGRGVAGQFNLSRPTGFRAERVYTHVHNKGICTSTPPPIQKYPRMKLSTLHESSLPHEQDSTLHIKEALADLISDRLESKGYSSILVEPRRSIIGWMPIIRIFPKGVRPTLTKTPSSKFVRILVGFPKINMHAVYPPGKKSLYKTDGPRFIIDVTNEREFESIGEVVEDAFDRDFAAASKWAVMRKPLDAVGPSF